MSDVLWTPSPSAVESTEVASLCESLGLPVSFAALHDWSTANPDDFWATVWDRYEIVGERGSRIIESGRRLRDARFFPDARLNVAENLLKRPDSRLAMTFDNEDGPVGALTAEELRDRVSVLQQAMRRSGVGAGDVVAAWLPNLPDTIAIFLAANSLGAIFTSSSPDFGANGVVDRFAQVSPKLLFATDAYLYGAKRRDTLDRLDEICRRLPSLEQTVLVPYLDPDVEAPVGAVTLTDFTSGLDAADCSFTRLGFDHPAFVLFSSGTTGAPKAIVHRGGGVLLKLVSEHRLHCDIRAGDRVFYFTTAGWMMWNWLVMALASDATLVLYDGSPFHPNGNVLFDLVDRRRISLFGISAKYVDAVNKAGLHPAETHDLSSLRTICSTGSTLVHESFRFVYDHIKSDVHLASMSGGTDLCGCLVAGDPTSPVHVGEIQAPAIGLDIAIVGEDGQELSVGEQGELVCRSPFPSIPLRLVGDDNYERFDETYFDRFPGSWHQGDFAEWAPGGGTIISGRSDATLNPGGVRIGTAEIYRQVERLTEIDEAIVVGQNWENDTRIVLFVRLADGVELTNELEATIRASIREGASPRHVPACVLSVPDIPRTRSGKISELAVRDVVHGRPVANTEALANPEALEHFRDRV